MLSGYDELITLDEMCRLLHIGKNTAYGLVNEGTVPAMKNGGKWIIPKKSIIDYIEHNLTGGKKDGEDEQA